MPSAPEPPASDDPLAGVVWLKESWEELQAQEVRERLALLALPPEEAQARADVLCARHWEPQWNDAASGVLQRKRRLPGV